jgi:hypothetical protein
MNPFLLMAKIAGVAFITAAGVHAFVKHMQPDASGLMAGTIHFRKGVEEFQKGFSAILFGTQATSPEQAKKERESRRITIE